MRQVVLRQQQEAVIGRDFDSLPTKISKALLFTLCSRIVASSDHNPAITFGGDAPKFLLLSQCIVTKPATIVQNLFYAMMAAP
jgi:hypothetical protein